MTRSKGELGPMGRTTAAILAVVWSTAGIAGVAISVAFHHWIGVVLSPFAVLYGVMWAQVARTGRRIRWPARHGQG